MFRKRMIRSIFSILFIAIAFLTACSNANDNAANTYDYAEEGPFVSASFSSAGPDDYRNMYSREIAIYSDGTLLLTTSGSEKLKFGADKPELKIQLKEEQIKNLQEKIKTEKFLDLPRDVTAPSEDGAFYDVTVYLQDETKLVGGLNPTNENFNAIHDAIFELLPKQEYAKWKEEVEEHIWEFNSLRTNDKTAYQEEEPFLSFVTKQTTDAYSYHYHFTLDVDGQLVITAEETDGGKIKSAPVLKRELTASELASIQETIQENFWKLNESPRSSGSNSDFEAITVYLTEEEKKVSGKGIEHPRFVKIKESILAAIDPADFAAWEKQVAEHMQK